MAHILHYGVCHVIIQLTKAGAKGHVSHIFVGSEVTSLFAKPMSQYRSEGLMALHILLLPIKFQMEAISESLASGLDSNMQVM